MKGRGCALCVSSLLQRLEGKTESHCTVGFWFQLQSLKEVVLNINSEGF